MPSAQLAGSALLAKPDAFLALRLAMIPSVPDRRAEKTIIFRC
jgi:hypothetical protein